MPRSFPTRRSFLKQLSLSVAAAPFAVRGLRAQAEQKIRHATFGTSGQALADVNEIAGHPAVEIVAGCDVDERNTAKFREKYPNARIYADFRELLEKEKDLHTVNVSTPDHMHGAIGATALRRGLHVYGQKPLTHDLYEARKLTELARSQKLVTQMGIQIHSSKEYRTAVKLVHDGAIGKVKEVHTWSRKTWGGDQGPLPPPSPIPTGLNWYLWIGRCEDRPYIGDGWYHPGNWRKRVDFGTGTFGDMGCHIFDPVFGALALTAPISVRSEGAAPSEHSWATNAVIHYVFPGTQYTEGETVNVTWYDGSERPPDEIKALAEVGTMKNGEPAKVPGEGSIIIGTAGAMVIPHIDMPRLVGDGVKDIQITPEPGSNHWHQFIDAVLGKGEATANFDYAGPLTEAVLLGSVATRFPKTTLNWDGPGLKFTNVEEANRYVRRNCRKGWEDWEVTKPLVAAL